MSSRLPRSPRRSRSSGSRRCARRPRRGCRRGACRPSPGPSCASPRARSATERTTASACSRVLTIGTITPWAPASSILPMMPGSFHGTRTIGVPPPSSIAWIIDADWLVVDGAVLRVDAHVVDRLAAGDLGRHEARERQPQPERLVAGCPLLTQTRHAGESARRSLATVWPAGRRGTAGRCRSSARTAGAARRRWPTRCAASRPRCGRSSSGCPAGNGSGSVTSSPAPARWPRSIASSRASWSTSTPRAQLTK